MLKHTTVKSIKKQELRYKFFLGIFINGKVKK